VNEQARSLAPDQLVLIYPGVAVEDDPLRRHLLSGRVEAVDEQGVRLRPFAGDVDSFQDYDSFVPWATVGLATVVTPTQLPRMREVLNQAIRRALEEMAQATAGQDRGVG
jgi:hypothetical protein